MKQESKITERGAIMVEILAVLALIGVMGPVLFRQVLTRNQEISNVNMASEMRTIKEAMSAMISADGAVLGAKCDPQSSSAALCSTPTNSELVSSLESFLPAGIVDMGIIDDYNVYLYGYQADFGVTGQPDVRNMVYGVILPKEDALPTSGWNFKRASRVASLIGADGGVVDRDTSYFVGTNGGWQLPMGGIPDVTYETPIVTTAFDTFNPDIGMVAPNAVSAPDDLAFKRLHAWQYFSVGSDTDKNDPKRCFRYERMIPEGGGDPVGDVIYNVGSTEAGGEACDPLFWVGTTGSTNDNSEAGQVYIKNNLYIGRENAGGSGGGLSAVAIETHDPDKTYTNEEDKNADRRIVVYDINGNPSITIDAMGRILSDKTVTAQNGEADGLTYQVDPAYTSVLNDIRLTSRGGARLSDILPNYIAKGMYSYGNGNSGTHPFTVSVPKPSGDNACPQGYLAAVVVTPLKWGGTNITNITIPQDTLNSDSHNLNAPAGGGSVTGTITVKERSMTDSDTGKQIKVDKNRENFSVEISPMAVDGNTIKGDTADGGSWTVRAGYKKTPTSSFDTSISLNQDEISLLAQTYCVYDESKFENIPDKERPTNP